jgi:alpha-glucoside transport system substrate-binding protein
MHIRSGAFARSLVGALVLAVGVAACGPGAGTSSGGGKTLHVLATWGGTEQKAFLAMVKPWEDRTGNKIAYEGTRDLNAVLTTRVAGGNPPDVAGLPGPGQMAQFATAGKLTALDSVVDMTAMKSQYAQSWIDLGSVNGKLYGIFIKASLKGLIWYDPKVVQSAGVSLSSSSAPKTWADLQAITSQLKAAGKTPWCIGLESGATSGWPGTDWIEDFVLRGAGPDVYKNWYLGKVKFSDPAIKAGWTQFGQAVAQAYGGKNYVLSTAFGKAGDPLFTSPPGCYLHHQASFITTFFQTDNPSAQPVSDFNFFGFPDINAQYSGAEEVGGDLFGLFKDSPEARDLIKYLTTPEAQQIWVSLGGALSPNKQVPLNKYPDALSKQAGQILVGAKVTAFDASDNMPDAMNTAFLKGILDYVSNPGSLDSVLAHLDQVQTDSYK